MLAVGAGLVGALVAGPLLSHAVLRWVGWRVALPLLLGWVPSSAMVGHSRPSCRSCGAPLSPRRLPALPWLAVGGRCRACREPIGRWALGVELATGALFALAAGAIGWSWLLPPTLVLFAGLVAISAVDLAHARIPTQFVYVTGLGVAVASLPLAFERPGDALVGAAVGGALCLGVLGTMHLGSPHMLGFGDVRLGTLIGLAVGWLGWTADEPVLDPLSRVVQAVFIAGIVGSLAGVVLLVLRRQSQAYPFGPCLALGGVVVVLLI